MAGTGRRRVRVTAGELKGRLLDYPAEFPFRPTMQRAKSSVLDSLAPWIRKSVFVDLYSAAGGVGIEALSRGASFCCFVERDARALSCLRRNLAYCRVATERYEIHPCDVVAFLEGGGICRLKPSVVFADPPYETDFAVLLELLSKIVYPATAKVVVEHAARVELTAPAGLGRTGRKSFGQTSVTFFEASP